MFLDDDLWILHGGKINTSDKEKLKRDKVEVSALDPLTGEVRKTYPAGMAHCFPPVCTPNYVFAGELDMTNLNSGEVDGQSHHKSQLLARKRLDSGQRLGLHHAQTLHLLADAAWVSWRWLPLILARRW